MNEPVLKPIDTDLPETVNVTLGQWNELFDRLGRQDPSLKTRDVFALTGHFRDPDDPDGPLLRANFDSTSCYFVEGMTVNQECDVDSIIAVMPETIPIRNDAKLDYYMLPDVRYTLKDDYHIPGVLVNDRGEEKEIPIHKIPNARFAEVGKNLIRIHFPGLRNEEQLARQKNSNYVPEAYMRQLYDFGMLPALQLLPPQDLRVMPGTFDTETLRARQGGEDGDHRNGPPTYQQSAKPIPGRYIEDVIRRLRERVQEVPELDWAMGFFFVLEGKNFKSEAISRHPAPDEAIENVDDGIDPEDPRGRAIHGLLQEFHVDRLKQEPARLYCDIATTVTGYKPVDEDEDLSLPVSLFPNAHYAAEIINYFTGKPINECERWVQTPKGPYAKDEEAHLGDFAGGRVYIRVPSWLQVFKLQWYLTSKYITYNVVLKQKARRTSPYMCEKDWATQRTRYFIPLAQSFRAGPMTHSVAVRFESRVPYSSYGRVHLSIPPDLLSQWLFWLNDDVYWGLKSRRLMAFNNVLNRFFTSEKRISITSQQVREYASLVVILIWMTNALVNRPDEGSHWDEVRDSASVHAIVGDRVEAVRDLTMFNLHSLHLEDPPRISSQRTITTKTLAYLFSEKKILSFTELIAKVQGRRPKPIGDTSRPQVLYITEDVWSLEDPENPPPEAAALLPAPRRANRQRVVNHETPDEVPNMFVNVFPQQAPVRYQSEEPDPEARDLGMDLGQRVTNIIHNLVIQLFGKVPNRKGMNQSWCLIEYSEVKYATVCDPKIPEQIFTSWVHCGHQPERWNGTVAVYFANLQKHDEIRDKALRSSVQGLQCLEAWQEWGMLLNEFDDATRTIIIQEARKKVNLEWQWLPWFHSNHLWKTGIKKSADQVPKGRGEGGPWIIFNPRFRRSSRR